MYFFKSILVLVFSIQLSVGAPVEADGFRNDGQRVIYKLEKPVHPFIGRVTEMSTIKWLLADKKYVAITGEHGIGKTELAKNYANEYTEDSLANVIWINCSTITEMVQDFEQLHQKLIGPSGTAKVQTVRNVFAHFKNKALFILDDVSEDNLFVKNLNIMIKGNPAVQVIVTSEFEGWDPTYFSIQKLPLFTIAESVRYIKIALKDVDIPTDETNCEELAKELNYLPLALKTVTDAIIKRNKAGRYTIDDVIRELKGEVPTTTTVRYVSASEKELEKEIEEDILEKIEQESKKIGAQIATGATHAWEKITGETAHAWQKIKDGTILDEIEQQLAYGASETKKGIVKLAEGVDGTLHLSHSIGKPVSSAWDSVTSGAGYVGDKVASGISQAGGTNYAWKKISNGASAIGGEISYGAAQAGKKVTKFASTVGQSVTSIFPAWI